MADESQVQVVADDGEAEADARFRRQQEFTDLVAEAVKRAEAMRRLELTLIYGSVLPPPEAERPPIHQRAKPRRD